MSSAELLPSPQIHSPLTDHQIQTWGQAAIAIEVQALQDTQTRLDANFVSIVRRLLACQGRVVVMGIGKSGHIGHKVAATLASTGTLAFFVHPAEALHGDLGMISAQDVVLILSHSGESDEIIQLLPALQRLGVYLIAMTAYLQSTLGQCANAVISSHVSQEACPLNLAPTASTTVQLALGDALAVALLQARGFKAADFAKTHPGGTLGRRLLTRVSDVMRQGPALPCVNPTTPLERVIDVMSEQGLGLAAVVDDVGILQGVFTDGDFRRLMLKTSTWHTLLAQDVMRANPHTIHPHELAAHAAQVMEEKRVHCLLVQTEDGRLVGAVSTHDLMRAKVI
jgi:arabinose-5-phosphate isomerase